MYRYLIGILFMLCCGTVAHATFFKITGRITDSAGTGLAGTSVSLLYPDDSTLAVFGISNSNGDFMMADVKEGMYVLQVALMGYYTVYRKLTLPLASGNDLGRIEMGINEAALLLNEVVISGEKVPLRIKGDTLEYNTGSYKVKPDAMVEDLLRKLPGVQVDNEGNIKSMGKTVSKVLVDGKEFFSDDPKVATKNLPADAVDKIQAFEKKSDATLFSGIDDGQREQTLNLLLKESKKTGYFGEVKGGLGLPEKYDASVRAFKFREKSQFAALGMLNNINKFGFTFQDYIDYNGGLSSMVRNGGTLNIDANEVPVDFGQPVTGKVTSGAAGLNYSIEPWNKSRLNLSYMGNGVDKFLEQYITSRNYTPESPFEKTDHSAGNTRNLNHRLAANWRAEIDSVHMLTFNAYGRLGNSKSDTKLQSASYLMQALQNSLNNQNSVWGNSAELGGAAGWVKKRSGKWSLMQLHFEGAYSKNKEKSEWYNTASYPDIGQVISDRQYRHNDLIKANGTLSLSVVHILGKGYFLEPSVKGGYDQETTQRRQGPLDGTDLAIDSLSPSFYRNVFHISPGLSLKKNSKKMQWETGLAWKAMALSPFYNGSEIYQRSYQYFLPSAMWQMDFATGKRLAVRYNTEVNAPGALPLLPVTDYSNPLLRTAGNPQLKPEYGHHLDLNYTLFDQFNMSSFFAMMDATYTRDKISWSRIIQPDLSQDLRTVNTSYALQARMNTQYARPVRKLGIQASLGLLETWSRTLSPVNGTDNINNTLSHQLELNCSNLNNDIWDIRWGGSITLSSAQYSIQQELNNTYYTYSGFAKINYRLRENWNFSLSGDITHYTAKSFDDPLTVPLLKAEVARYLFSNQRGTISISGFDLLDRNKAIQRSSQLNYLMEQRSNTIGRYVMLSFSYKLNRAGRKSNGPGSIRIGAE